jgi:hypothetical protein
MKAIFALLMLVGVAPAQDKPQVYIQIRSHGSVGAAINLSRWQKSFEKNCDMHIATVRSDADYTVLLSHVGDHDQIEVASKNGDSLATAVVGGIKGGACGVILADWQKPQSAPAQEQQSEDAQGQDQQAQPEPQTVQLGQTPDQVRAALGQPDKVVNLGSKQIYVYKDLKITFVSEKVSDVQ